MRACPPALVVLLGCGSSPPAATTPEPAPDPAPPVVAVDAAPDAGISAELEAAPAWIFRYSGGDRVETWTLRLHGEQALLVVEGQATTRYWGPATGTAPIALRLRAPNAAMSLDCKPAKRPIGTRCNDGKAPALEVLDCFHPDFQEPMTFAPAPGVEFSTAKGCNGYRRLP